MTFLNAIVILQPVVRNVLAATLQYREVADPHWVLQESLEANSPAGHSPLSVAPVALDAGQAGITVQAVVAAAALQLNAVKFCNTHVHTH